MNIEIKREYARLRLRGWRATDALRAARARIAFEEAEDDGLVRFEREPDFDLYDDSFLTDERARKELWKRIEREGVWGIYTSVFLNGQWIDNNGVGGFIGNDWQDSGYDTDVMQSALDMLGSESGLAARFS